MSEKLFFFVKREIPLLFLVNCERADLFFVKRDLYPPFTTLNQCLTKHRTMENHFNAKLREAAKQYNLLFQHDVGRKLLIV